MTTISGHTTRAPGTILTATIYNFDHVNHVTNAQNLNATKLEGATPPVVDGHIVVFSGTSGAAIRTSGVAPLVANAALFNAIKVLADETTTGVVEKATVAEFRAAVADKYVAADLIETAAVTVSLSDAATVALDWDAGINFTLAIGGNRTLGLPTNGQAGTWRTLLITQDGTGGRTLAYAAGYVKPGGTAIVIAPAAGAITRLSIFCRTAAIFEVYPIGIGLA